MNREVKFRGKRLDNGEWAIGSLLIIGKYAYVYYGYAFPSEVNFEYDFHSVDPSTVGQYTGLKDKNGKEIYEGDIAKTHTGNIDVITYDEIAFNMCMAYASAPDGKCVRFFGENNPLSGINIIGNIYENQELLKTE